MTSRGMCVCVCVHVCIIAHVFVNNGGCTFVSFSACKKAAVAVAAAEAAYQALPASSPPSVLFFLHLSFLMSRVLSPPNKIPLALNEVELAASCLHLI